MNMLASPIPPLPPPLAASHKSSSSPSSYPAAAAGKSVPGQGTETQGGGRAPLPPPPPQKTGAQTHRVSGMAEERSRESANPESALSAPAHSLWSRPSPCLLFLGKVMWGEGGGKRKRGTYNSTARKWKRGGGESVSCFYLRYPDRKTKEAKKPFRRTNEKAVHARDLPPPPPVSKS